MPDKLDEGEETFNVAVLIFDCETVPDLGALRRVLGEPDADASDEEVLERWQEAHGGKPPLKPALQRVVAIAGAWIGDDGKMVRCTSLGEPDDGEAVLVRQFFRLVEEKRPRLAGWNTGGYDLPLLVVRAMVHGIQAPGFYRVGGDYKGYRKRYDEEYHLDLMDVLGNYGAGGFLKLDEAAAVLGIPGKLGVDGSQVWAMFQRGETEAIRAYCETDVLTTALVYGRYAHHRG